MKTPHRLLLVDDHPNNLQVLGEILEGAGFEIRIATSGAGALATLESDSLPHLILTDVLMPEMDGFEFCRRLKSDPRTLGIPVLFLSASEASHDRLRGFQVGGVDFITKPFLAEEVVARVSTHCRLTRIEFLEREIREKESAWMELQASREQYRTILTTAMDGYLLMDARGTILETNPAYAAMSGYAPEELVGRGLRDLEVPSPDAPFDAFLEAVRENGGRRIESRHRRRDGTILEVEVSAQHLGGDHDRFVAFLRDLTATRAEEAKKKALEEFVARQQRSEGIGRLAAGIAHDYNNMLGVIQGHLELASCDLPRDNPVQQNLEIALKAARRSAELTRQILTYARKQPMVHEIVNLDECAAATVGMLKRLLGDHIELAWNPGTGTWPIRMAPSQIDQILTNLCINAKDAIGDAESGTIAVRTENVKISEETDFRDPDCPAGDYVRLQVSDTGCGMDERTLSQAFDPFFTTKEVGKGTGLGLSVVHGIVKQAGGFSEIRSRPGVGTSISLYFPRQTATTPKSSPPGSSVGETFACEPILLVEDEIELLHLTRSMLEHVGFEVDAFASPLEALRSLRDSKTRYCMLITDVAMPQMNGIALSREFGLLHPPVPRLFVSGNPGDVVERMGILPFSVGLLRKPFSISQLAGKIRELQGG